MEPYVYAGKVFTECPFPENFKTDTHELYEIFCFVSGDVNHSIEGYLYNLKPDDILIIKKCEAHRLLIGKPVPFCRYVVHFHSEAILGNPSHLFDVLEHKPLGKFNRISATEFQKSTWLYFIDKMVQARTIEEKRIYLSVIFHELCQNLNLENYEEGDQILKYINRNLMSIQSLSEICKHFYISKTHLNKHFKQIIGTTVWDYIITKRLIIAKDLLNEGHKPNWVAQKCGYSEYSAFYKAYKKQFHISPKDDYVQKIGPP